VLPVEGAPLVFSTGYAHDVHLSLTGSDGKTINLAAKADAQQGGFVVDTSGVGAASLGNVVHATLQGQWGFEPFGGPAFQLVNARKESWRLAADESATIVGREDTIHLEASSVSCIDRIMVRDPAGKELEAEWKAVRPNEVEVKLPLQAAQPGQLTLLVKQYGASSPQPVQLQAFAEAAHLESFTLHAGDSQGVLTGSRLDEVAGLAVAGVAFAPAALASSQGVDQLTMSAQDAAAAAALKAGDAGPAKVRLKDGRVLDLEALIAAPRPSVALIGKSVQPSSSNTGTHIQLADDDELPQRARLTFSVRAKSPAAFGRDEMLEIATADGSYSTTLSLANGGITLENRSVAIARLDPAQAFGPSAFGPLQFRVVAGGVTGDWQPLAMLVRLPKLRALVCPATPELACKLSGSNLFLVESISTDPAFSHPVQVPDGFPGYSLPVPHPRDGQLFVKLRDDPGVINLAAVDTRELPPTPQEAERATERHAAATPPSGELPAKPTPAQVPKPAPPDLS
ncbi:MAG TPA: hypothetical protein VGN43_13475, partial [Steroidobacteraceae bacterium]|nr:hypothetical protein [Steroidobacteraceae bacterium]